MGFLREHKNNGQIPYYTGLQIQTSGNNIPIAIVWGANKIAPNCIWTGGFYGYYGYAEGSAHGKGGGNGGLFNADGNSGRQSWQYYTSWEMGLCEGPISGIGTIWEGQSATNTYGADIWAVYYGTQSQTPWSLLYDGWSGQALSYHGLAYITSFNYYLGTSATLPQYSIEILGALFNSSGINGGDADPAQIIQDFLTNSQYGVGFPAGSIDATTLLSPSSGPDSSYQGYCRASYLALSPVLTNQEPANSILARWLKLTNAAVVWSGGRLKFIPYGDAVAGPTPNQFVSGGVTFTPNLTPIYSLTDDDFIHEVGKDPVEITRVDPYACHNWQRLQINERINSWLPLNVNEPWVLWQTENSYIPLPIDVWDQNAIESYGLRMAPDIQANEICDPRVGQIAAQLILQRDLYIRNYYKFKLSFEHCLLDPMDLLNITDIALGLNNVTVRITEIEEDDSGLLAITAEEFPVGIASAVQYQTQRGGGNSTNQNVVPARVNTPIIFEPPASLTNGIAKIFIAASGGVASAYLLAETDTSGQHYASHAYNSTITIPSLPVTTTVTFSIYVQPVARSAVRLTIYNGLSQLGADFNLGAIPPSASADSGVTASIIGVSASWYQLTLSTTMAVSGIPVFFVYLETMTSSGFTSTYGGTAGDGVYLWGQQFSWSNSDGSASTQPTLLPAFASTSGATLAAYGVATPEGLAGIADPNWGGANVWLSTDGSSYTLGGVITGPSRQGYLTADFGNAGGFPDTTDKCYVTLQESGGTLASGSAIDAQSGVTLCLVDQELFSYVTATLQASPPAHAYELSTLYRGQYGTTATTHSAGTPFVRVDNSVFQFPLPAAFIGITLYVKLQSFNVFGSAIEDLSDCQVFTYTPNGAGSPIGPVTQALVLGQNLDFGLVATMISEADQWGMVTGGAIVASVDLGEGL